MRTYEIIIKPTSGFSTPLKGDTLFGHICWQAFYDPSLFGMSLDKLLLDYQNNPFLVVSSAFLKIGDNYYLKRPDLPLDMLFEYKSNNKADIIARRKELKTKKWMQLDRRQRLSSIKNNALYLNESDLLRDFLSFQGEILRKQFRKKSFKSIISDFTQPHNTINRLTRTTGEGQFSPYSVDQRVFIPELELVLFVGIRNDISIKSVEKALKQIGIIGFGKDASTGLGKFDLTESSEIDLNLMGSENPNAYYTLSPCVPEKDYYQQLFFTPFTRFGRHGDILAKSGKPFKNPIIMADEGAVFIAKSNNTFAKPYLGTAISGISKAEPNTVSQGYSLYIPLRVEV